MSSRHKIRHSKAILWDINSKHYKGSKIYKETTNNSTKFPTPIVFSKNKFQPCFIVKLGKPWTPEIVYCVVTNRNRDQDTWTSHRTIDLPLLHVYLQPSFHIPDWLSSCNTITLQKYFRTGVHSFASFPSQIIVFYKWLFF